MPKPKTSAIQKKAKPKTKRKELNIPLPPDADVQAAFEPELDADVDEPMAVPTEENGEILLDEPLEIPDPTVAFELSEDPVRLYLREIGQVKLLDADSEFRLSTVIEAGRLASNLQKRHYRPETPLATSVYRALVDELATSWVRLGQDAKRLNSNLPDLALVLTEAQHLHLGWDVEAPSYLRAYLDNGRWGTDPLWDGLVLNAYTVLLTLYCLPEFTTPSG